MIQFQWEFLSDDRFRISVRTPQTLVGTLHRLCVAMYSQGLDIISGNVYTEEENGELFSHDNFVLRVPRSDHAHLSVNESTARLGELMEHLLARDTDASLWLDERKLSIPTPADLFTVSHRIEFTRVDEQRMTRMFLETADRPGLLLFVTRTLARFNISVYSAVILSTDTGLAEDTLYLQFENKPLSEALERTLLFALEGRPLE